MIVYGIRAQCSAFGRRSANAAFHASRQMQRHAFEQGDALVFVSHKYHCVAPVESGERRVLVIELWEGDEKACPHRCTERSGTCMLGAEAVQGRACRPVERA